MRANLYDTLFIPATGRDAMRTFMMDFVESEDYIVSDQKVAALLYNFAKADVLTPRAMEKLEKSVYRHRVNFDNNAGVI